VDGAAAPLLRVNVVLRAVPVPAGKHTVVLVYHPHEFLLGAMLSGMGSMVALGAALLWLLQKRKKPLICGDTRT
jgi:uncharacterized membrane protein YfhO